MSNPRESPVEQSQAVDPYMEIAPKLTVPGHVSQLTSERVPLMRGDSEVEERLCEIQKKLDRVVEALEPQLKNLHHDLWARLDRLRVRQGQEQGTSAEETLAVINFLEYCFKPGARKG